MMKKCICLGLLVFTATGYAVAPYFSIRSQSKNAARELAGAGWNTQINLCCMDEWYGNFSITPEYTKSFRPCRIAQCLFGCFDNCCGPCGPCDNACSPCGSCYDNCCNDSYRINISGSHVDNRGACDWLADYFGLPPDYQSCVTFEPRIDNFLIDFNLYLGLDEWCKGLYFRIHAPVVHTKWDLNMCECVQAAGEANHPVGYFNKSFEVVGTTTVGIQRNNLVPNFTTFISGCGVITSNDFVFNPLCHAKMSCCDFKETALSDIQMALGYNIWCDDDYHFGLNLRAAAPTGTRPTGMYLFEPIVGNGKHWELGAGMNTHWCFWSDECNCKSMAFYIDANVTHLFKTRQCRTFDLCGKPLSRYMLAAQYKTPVENLLAGPNVASGLKPSKQFAGIYSPIANLTTFAVDVSVGAQADLVFMLQYVHNNWSFDLGYNFWGRSCEKIVCPCDCCLCFDQNQWGLKGDAFMYGFEPTAPLIQPGIALSATQSKATLFSGTNNYPDGDETATPDVIDYEQNPGIDNRQLAFSSTSELVIPVAKIGANNDIYTSLDPVLLNFCDIDFCSARTKGRSHKLFMNFDYTWCDYECSKPYLGIGFEVEFGQKPCDECCDECNSCCTPCGPSNLSFENNCIPCYNPGNTSCVCCNDCCSLCAVSQWGIWLKGGFGF